MLVIGVTGGVASGKTELLGHLSRLCKSPQLSADEIVKNILEEEKILNQIKQRIGTSVFIEEQKLDKRSLQTLIFHSESARKTLESILHPKVRQTWLDEVAKLEGEKRHSLCLIEVPLLFETGAEVHFNKIIQLAASPELQIQRLTQRRRFSLSLAQKMISAQMATEEKMLRSDFVIWNDGSTASLLAQGTLLAGYLMQLTN